MVGKAWREWVSRRERKLWMVVVLLTAGGMLLGLDSYFLPWYFVYEFYINELLGIMPWYLTGDSVEYVLIQQGMKGLYTRGIFLGSFIGLVVTWSLAYLSQKYDVPMFHTISLLIILLLPWISTTSLYILCGYPTGVPIGRSLFESRFVPVFASGFYINLGASVLLLLALGLSVAAGSIKKRGSGWSVRGALKRMPLISGVVLMGMSAYLPWYVDQSNFFIPEFLLPVTLGISFSIVILFSVRDNENMIAPLLILISSLILLSPPQDPDLWYNIHRYGVGPALLVLQTAALFWVVVSFVWIFFTSFKHDREDVRIIERDFKIRSFKELIEQSVGADVIHRCF